MTIINLNNENFEEEVNKSAVPVIVDCWGEGCPSCKIIEPILEELSKEYKGKLKFCKLNMKKNMELARKLTILSIPTLLFFGKGKEIDRLVDPIEKDILKEKIDRLIR